MTTEVSRKTASRRDYAAPLVGLGTLIAFLAIVEALIRAGLLNRFIIPPPSEIIGSFGRLFLEENIVHRFFFTAGECLVAGVMVAVSGIAIGVVMQRFSLLQRACETWVAAFASAPLVLTYPLFMVIFGRNAWTIIMMGFLSSRPSKGFRALARSSSTSDAASN
jgi:ABC-type nitrate/sulfonate/bicarbonate transport system permease component